MGLLWNKLGDFGQLLVTYGRTGKRGYVLCNGSTLALSPPFILAIQGGWSCDHAVKVDSVEQMLAGRLEESTIEMGQAAPGTTGCTYIALALTQTVGSPAYPHLRCVLRGCA